MCLPVKHAAIRLFLAVLLSLTASLAAPYRLNRSSDSALALYVDNGISAVEDARGGLHLVYTDSAPERKWQVYYRSLVEGYWSIPVRLTAGEEVRDSRSPQIAFDPVTKNLYVTWLGLAPDSAARRYKLFVGKIDPSGGEYTPLAAFDYGTTSFRPTMNAAPGRLLILSEERLDKRHAVFRARVLFTASGQWTERQLQNSPGEMITFPAIAASAEQAALFWVRTTSAGYDIMISTLPATAAEWREEKPVFRSPGYPEALTASTQGKLISLAWSVRGGGRNSILMHTASHDGGDRWTTPAVIYSIQANAGVTMTALSEKEIAALLHISDAQGEKIKMKYSTDGGQSWLPQGEIAAIDIAPAKDAIKAQRPSLAVRDSKTLILTWEEWKTDGPALVFKVGAPERLANAPRQPLLAEGPADRFLYYPQVWRAGGRAFVTYASKRRPRFAMEVTSANDLYITELPAALKTQAPPRKKK